MYVGARKRRGKFVIVAAIASTALLGAAAPAVAQRVLGLDISAWQGNVSQTTWNNIYNVENREFVFIRSSRGGTTGYYNQSDPNNNNGLNTLSQRYDDPYFVQNINRSTTAGMFAGSYHFSRPDIIASTQNSGGIANTGADEANHFMQMAGAWMRPGYLLPVHDLEAGDGARSDNAMAQFALDFSNRIYDVMGIRPAIYVNGNYAQNVLGGASSSLRAQVVEAYPTLWIARWPNQANPHLIDVQGSQPSDSLDWLYGVFDDYGDPQPWDFWQYTSTGRLQSFNNGGSNLDMNVSQGDIEVVKDHLVPALWMDNSSGDWSTLAKWNSGQAPIAPVTGPGQVNPVGTQTLPTPRLPGAAGSGPTSGQHDTVILDRPSANITVTISSGTHNIRKLFVRETLNITGGSLTVNYDPDYATAPGYPLALRSGPISAQFSGAVSLSGSGALSVDTLQVDSTRTFTLGGGTLTFEKINLMPHSSSPAKIAVTGDVNINPLDDATATIARGAGSGATGTVDLGGGNRTLNVGNGAADVDLLIDVPVTNGTLTKSGLGTMRLGSTANTHSQTNINDGILLVTANNQLGPGNVTTNMTVDTPGSGGSGHGGTLKLSNNVNYNKTLVINGAGLNGASLTAPGGPGALDNASGDNTWSGTIELAGAGSGGTDPLMNQIGAQAGTLRLSGPIVDGAGVNATWAKTGNADVVLSGPSANTYTGLTRISGGRLIVEKDGALGAAGSSTSATGNTFQLAGSASTLAFRAPSGNLNYSTFEVINTHGTGAPGHGQVDSLSGVNTFAGRIAFDGPNVSGFRQGSIGVTSGILTVSGGLYARGNDGSPRNITKLGTGTLILSGDGGAATGDPLVAPLTSSSFTVDAGAVVLIAPSDTTANLPGVTRWNIKSGGALEALSGLFATDAVSVEAGGQFNLAGGTAIVNTLELLGGGDVNINGGSLHVNTVQGSLTNVGGALSPGNSIGTTLVSGNYTQQSNAVLDVEIGGVGQSDFLVVSGTATFDGAIDVTLLNGYTPAAGQQFTVVGAPGGLVNNGLTLGGPAAGSFTLVVGANSVILEAIVANLPGDFNGDGFVDASDYIVWRATAGTPTQYQEWLDNFGQSSGGGAGSPALAPVPEPACLALLAIAVGLLQVLGGRYPRPRQ